MVQLASWSRVMSVETLLSYLFDGSHHPLASSLGRWMADSARFKTFAEGYRDKIRKKIRGLRDSESWRDLQFELEMAHLLLQVKQFSVAYEPYASGKTRGPDFAVTFKGHYVFNVEVTRMRAVNFQAHSGQAGAIVATGDGHPPAVDYSPVARRLTDIVCSKLGQLQPGMPNLLTVVAERSAADGLDINAIMQALKLRVERQELVLFERHGLRGSDAFFKSFQLLSGLLLRYRGGNDDSAFGHLWLNTQTKHPLPKDIRNKLEK